MLSEASQVVKTRPEVDQLKTIFEATQILPILSGNRDGALLGINSNWLDISKFEFHYGEDLDWYPHPGIKSAVSWKKENSLMKNRRKPFPR